MLLEAVDISKSYGHRKACADICLSLPEGQVFGLLGPNGAGKTTIIKIFLDLVAPDTGQVLIQGRPARQPASRLNTGYLPELFRMYEWLTATEWLKFNSRVYGLPGNKEKVAISRAFSLVGLQGREKDRIRDYSKGMQQRLALAAAIVHSPALLFLDEPTSALDPLGRVEVRDVIRHMQDEGVTIFLNSHLLSEVEMTCDWLGFIKQGRLLREGPASVFVGSGKRAVFALADSDGESPAATAPDLAARLGGLALPPWNYAAGKLEVAISGREDIPGLLTRLLNAGLQVFGAQLEERSLEDAFLEIMGAEEALS